MGLSWASAETHYEGTDTNRNEAQYGTRAPILSDAWKAAFTNFSGNVNPSGANDSQQRASDYFRNLLNGGGEVNAFTTPTNAALTGRQGELNGVTSGYGRIAGQGAPQATASTAAPSLMVSPQTGTAAAQPYLDLYGKELIDPALAEYDYGVDRGMTALDARSAAGGGFANSRTGVNYGDAVSQNARGRGSLYASLRAPAITSSLGFGAGDQGRFLTADEFNVGNTNDINKFNAGQTQQASEFNVGAQQTNTGQQLAALGGQAQTILANAGLSQQILQNVITRQGINTDAAQALFTAGSITQAQLDAILSAAGAGNGSSFTQNTDTKTNVDRYGGSIGLGTSV